MRCSHERRIGYTGYSNLYPVVCDDCNYHWVLDIPIGKSDVDRYSHRRPIVRGREFLKNVFSLTIVLVDPIIYLDCHEFQAWRIVLHYHCLGLNGRLSNSPIFRRRPTLFMSFFSISKTPRRIFRHRSTFFVDIMMRRTCG